MNRPTCPHCGGHRFRIDATTTVTIYFLDAEDHEREDDDGDMWWEENAAAQCVKCNKTTSLDETRKTPLLAYVPDGVTPSLEKSPAKQGHSIAAISATGERSLLELGVALAPAWVDAWDLHVVCGMGQVDAPDLILAGSMRNYSGAAPRLVWRGV